MKLTILGRFGPFPAVGGACSSYLLTAGSTKLVLDMGSGSFSRLIARTSINDIDAVVLSHLHFDHISDLFMLQYAAEYRNNHGSNIKIRLFMPRTPENYAALVSTDVFDIVYIDDNTTAEVGGVSLSFRQMTHPVECYAVKVVSKRKQKTLVYTGDTTLNEAIVPFAQDADIMLCDAKHMTVEGALNAGNAACARTILLTHRFPEYDGNESDWAAEGSVYDA